MNDILRSVLYQIDPTKEWELGEEFDDFLIKNKEFGVEVREVVEGYVLTIPPSVIFNSDAHRFVLTCAQADVIIQQLNNLNGDRDEF